MSRFRQLTPESRMRFGIILALVATAMICGTLALGVSTYFRLRTEIHNVAALTVDVTQKNVDARYGGCLSGDALRRALYAQALESRRTTPLLLTLFPQLNTKKVRRLIAVNSARQLRAYAPLGAAKCAAYALESVPARVRSHYHAP